jgi:hypothetical protein
MLTGFFGHFRFDGKVSLLDIINIIVYKCNCLRYRLAQLAVTREKLPAGRFRSKRLPGMFGAADAEFLAHGRAEQIIDSAGPFESAFSLLKENLFDRVDIQGQLEAHAEVNLPHARHLAPCLVIDDRKCVLSDVDAIDFSPQPYASGNNRLVAGK